MPAYFRFLTILAFHVFLQEKVRSQLVLRSPGAEQLDPFILISDCLAPVQFVCGMLASVDLAVVEVGIGGAYDCTNIIRWDSLFKGGCCQFKNMKLKCRWGPVRGWKLSAPSRKGKK
ncbi:hypothetical protein XENOCAPTIV_020210 [Xenoophorus captivus]|uniref:Secreted protein n=1 Tax=Xenoophorus captivus TaxID=1517983 RepID=A0ABV0S8P6_9TELE